MITKVVAHRGSKGTAPENTIESFKQALEVGSDGIELDVHLSKDRVPVVIHDEMVDRTTDGTGAVSEMTVDQLKRLDAGAWFHPSFTGSRIPTLAEVFALLTDSQFTGMLNIELKTDQNVYEGIEKIVLDLVDQTKPIFSIVYSSFNYETIERLVALDSSVDFALLFSDLGREQSFLSNGMAVKAWHPHHMRLSYLKSKNVHSLPLRVWTVNRTINLVYCFNKKLDSVITDFPEKALKVRKLLQGE